MGVKLTMLTNVDHSEFILTTISNAVKTSSDQITPDTVVKILCKDGQVVTTDRSLVLSFSPFLRSVICSAPSSAIVISLPDASSTGVQGVLNMISKRWENEEINILTKEQVEVLRTFEIPVGDLEKVQTVEFSVNEAFTDTSLAKESKTTNSSPKCSECGMDFGEVSEDTKDEVSIHIGEIHSEVELLTEFSKLFPGGSNKCGGCDLEVNGEYVQKEHIMLEHPWPMLKATVEEIIGNVDLGENTSVVDDDIINEKQVAEKVPLQQVEESMFKVKHTNVNNQFADAEHSKAKGGVRGRKRKSGLESSKAAVFSLYVPQRKSAKKASLHITKSFEGKKKYKQQDIGMFVKKVKGTEPKFTESALKDSRLNDTDHLIEDIDKLLQDSDEDYFGDDINYDASSFGEISACEVASADDIEGIQDHLEFSDSDDGKEDLDDLNYSIKVENMSWTDDLPEIQQGIEFSDSEEDD